MEALAILILILQSVGLVQININFNSEWPNRYSRGGDCMVVYCGNRLVNRYQMHARTAGDLVCTHNAIIELYIDSNALLLSDD